MHQKIWRRCAGIIANLTLVLVALVGVVATNVGTASATDTSWYPCLSTPGTCWNMDASINDITTGQLLNAGDQVSPGDTIQFVMRKSINSSVCVPGTGYNGVACTSMPTPGQPLTQPDADMYLFFGPSSSCTVYNGTPSGISDLSTGPNGGTGFYNGGCGTVNATQDPNGGCYGQNASGSTCYHYYTIPTNFTGGINVEWWAFQTNDPSPYRVGCPGPNCTDQDNQELTICSNPINNAVVVYPPTIAALTTGCSSVPLQISDANSYYYLNLFYDFNGTPATDGQQMYQVTSGTTDAYSTGSGLGFQPGQTVYFLVQETNPNGNTYIMNSNVVSVAWPAACGSGVTTTTQAPLQQTTTTTVPATTTTTAGYTPPPGASYYAATGCDSSGNAYLSSQIVDGTGMAAYNAGIYFTYPSGYDTFTGDIASVNGSTPNYSMSFIPPVAGATYAFHITTYNSQPLYSNTVVWPSCPPPPTTTTTAAITPQTNPPTPPTIALSVNNASPTAGTQVMFTASANAYGNIYIYQTDNYTLVGSTSNYSLAYGYDTYYTTVTHNYIAYIYDPTTGSYENSSNPIAVTWTVPPQINLSVDNTNPVVGTLATFTASSNTSGNVFIYEVTPVGNNIGNCSNTTYCTGSDTSQVITTRTYTAYLYNPTTSALEATSNTITVTWKASPAGNYRPT